MTAANINAGVQLNALDPNSLGDLKRLARTDGQSDQALRAAAKQFEALFVQMVMKSMRNATPSGGLLDSEQGKLFQGLLDQQLSLNMAQGKGTGLAETLYRQLGGKAAGGALEALDTGNAGPSAGFDLANVVRRAAIPAARMPAAESAAGALAALSQGADALAITGTPRGDSGAVDDITAVAERAALQARLSDAIRSAREATGALSTRAKSFVADVWPHAVEASRKTGIPPQFMVAQAALETGWGERQLRQADGSPSYNLFNIKAGSSWGGRTVNVSATEYANGRAYSEPSNFRAYGSYAESFADYARLLSSSPRYAAVLGQRDADGFARGLQQAGYATDPMYADKLARIIGGSTLRNALASAA